MFDPKTFLQATIKGETSTVPILVPEGAWKGIAQEVTEKSFRQIETKNGLQTVMDVTWQIDDPKVTQVTHRPINRVRQTLFLDLTPEGRLDNAKGLNIDIGRLREAIGQAKGDWGFSRLTGQMALIEVVHNQSGERTFANVDSTTKLGAPRK